MNGIRELSDLQVRLVRAAEELAGLAQKAAASHATTEYARLDGKREGVNLALSYTHEALRDAVAAAARLDAEARP